MKESKYIKEKLEPIVKKCKTFSDVFRKFNNTNTVHGGSSFYLRNKIKELNIDTSHFDMYHKQKGSKTTGIRYSMDEFIDRFLNISPAFIRTSVLKDKLIGFGIKNYECENCGNKGEWQGKKLILQLDHINGIRTDNRIENLRILCPNCHTQTTTYCGKNNK